MRLEDLFLSVIDEMRTTNESFRPWHYNGEYKLLRLAGLLRQMLTDNTRLLYQINQLPEFRIKVTFEVNKRRDLGSGTDFSQLTWLDPYNTPLGKTSEAVPEEIEVFNIDNFLAIPVVRLDASYFTVIDLINYYANLDGAVHRTEELNTNDARFQPLRDSEEAGQRLDGCPLPMSMLRTITSIVLKTLEPWESAIRGKQQQVWNAMEEDLVNKGFISES